MNCNETTVACDDEFMSRSRRRRARRAQRRSTMHRGTQLNIVSLIDVFAVLVFFLLSGASITAGRYQQLPLTMPASAPSASQADEGEPLRLTVTLLENSIVVADNSGELGRFSKADETGEVDRSLSEMLSGIKAAHPEERQATLRVAAGIAYVDIVNVMDILSHAPGGGGRTLFPDISLGDALLAEVRR